MLGLDYSPHILGAAPEEVKAIQQRVMEEQIRLANGT